MKACPLPLLSHSLVTIGHGGGGKLTAQLIDRIFRPIFASPSLEEAHDAAKIHAPAEALAFSTDSYVVSPLFFPGGDIGKLSVFGTANDLAMAGARPLFLSCGFILEEGFPMGNLVRIAESMKRAADEVGAEIVAGDTKVVERGKGDGVYINTSGIGVREHPRPIGPSSIRPGDVILLSGDIGRHGIAILASRAGIEFGSSLESDCASLTGAVQSLLASEIEIHCLRDLTRGGLATALVEVAETSNLEFHVHEPRVPVSDAVRGACELLGLDPCYVANEGRFVAFVPACDAERALALLRALSPEGLASDIGSVQSSPRARGRVVLRTGLGGDRILARLSGEQLPRIC